MGNSALLLSSMFIKQVQTLMMWLKSQFLQVPTALHLASKPEVLMPVTSVGTSYLKRPLKPDYRYRVISSPSQEALLQDPVTRAGVLGMYSTVLMSVQLRLL